MYKLIVRLGGSFKATLSVTVEKRIYDGNYSHRAAQVGTDIHYLDALKLIEICRYMALPQHKKLPQPAEGTTFG